MNRLLRQPQPAVIQALEKMAAEPDLDRHTVLEMGLFYAQVGRDKHKLGQDFLDLVRGYARLMHRMRAPVSR